MHAILADNDLVALSAMEPLGAAGGCVPEAVSVADLDDTPLAALANPARTCACPATPPTVEIDSDILRTPMAGGQPGRGRLATRPIVRDGIAPHRIDGGGA